MPSNASVDNNTWPSSERTYITSEHILIRGGLVLTLDSSVGNHRRADVHIQNGRIVEVADGLRVRDAEVIDVSDSIVMPGFVDTHRHTWKSLFRNLGAHDDTHAVDDGRHYQPEDIYASTLVGLLGAVEAGITTVVDWADIPDGPSFTEAVLQAHTDAGLRTIFVHTAPAGSEAEIREMAARQEDQSRTTYAIGSANLVRHNQDRNPSDWELARELGLRIHAHAGLNTDDQGVVAELGASKLLGDDVTLVHCSKLSDGDLDAVASSGTQVSLTPSTEMAGGLGAPPIQQLLDRKIRLGLGVDDEHLTPGDIFAQMRAIISLQHATYFDLKLAGKAGLPNLLTTRELIRYGTSDGALVVGLGDTTGTLTPGKRADAIVLRTDRPNIFPINDPIGAVVWGMDTSNLEWVIADGQVLMREGALVGDVALTRTLAIEAQRRVAAAAGLTSSGVGQ